MKYLSSRGTTSHIAFVFLPDSTSTTGAGKTGLTNASAGLNIAVRREKSAAFTSYTGANISTITTLGTWADPTSGKCRFKEVDATNAPGLYELHFVDALYDTSDTSRKLLGFVQATGVAPTPFEIVLTSVDIQSSTAFITGVNSLTPPTNWNLSSIDANGRVDVIKINGQSQTARDIGASVLLTADETNIVRSGTAQAGTSTTLTLDSGASSVNGYYEGDTLIWTSGANNKVPRIITNYVGATKVVTFGKALPATADATPTFVIKSTRTGLLGSDGRHTISTDVQDLRGTLKTQADLYYLLGTLLTEGAAGQISAAFENFFDQANPQGNVNSLPATAAGVELGLPVLVDLTDQPYALLGVYAGVAGIGNGSGAATSSVQTTQTATLARIIGLLGKNQGLRNITLDGNGNLLTADLCVYSSKGNAQTNDGTTGLLYKYSIVDSYSGTNLASHVETEEV
jgi:hypothetical protein